MRDSSLTSATGTTKKPQNIVLRPAQLVGVTGFEPATTRPPDVYSNRAELHPDGVTCVVTSTFRSANIALIFKFHTFLTIFLYFF